MRRLKGFKKGMELKVSIYSKSNPNKITSRKIFRSQASAIRHADRAYFSGRAVKITKI